MKYIRLLFYILFISKTIIIWGGENIGGLSFRAYEYSKMNVLHLSYRPAIRE